MINGQIQLQGFTLTIREAQQDELDESGQPTGEQHPVRVLFFQDQQSGFGFHAILSPEQFDQFADQVAKSRKKIIQLDGGRPFWTRNGDMRG